MTARRGGRTRKRAPSISIIVEEPRWLADPSVVPLMRKALRLALASKPHPDYAPARATPPSVTVLLGDDRRLRALNTFFRGKEKATNVLSFSPGRDDADYLGDIALALGVVTREARAQRKLLAEHVAHLAVHGVLHLLGYDHERASEAEIMESQEIALLERLGIADPYRPRAYAKRRKKDKA